MNAISASLTAPLQSPGVVPSAERAVEPMRPGTLERRPVNATESTRRESGDSRQSQESIQAPQVLEGEWLDAQVAQLLDRAGDDRQATDERGQAPRDPAMSAASQRQERGSTLGFSDWRSALSYWESIEPQRVRSESLPAPIAAYRDVEAGPAPTLGFSATA